MSASPTILVVDDDAPLRLVCRVNLELEGYRVLEAGSLGAAAAELARGPVDLVLLDIHVGQDDGLALLADIRERRPGVPVALLSGTSDLDASTRESADGVIPKPFTLEELIETVARLAPR